MESECASGIRERNNNQETRYKDIIIFRLCNGLLIHCRISMIVLPADVN